MSTRNFLLLCSGMYVALACGCAGKDAGKVAALQKEKAALEAKVQKLEAQVGSPGAHAAAPALPAALDALYPPKAEQPIYTMSMLGLATPLESMVADLMDQDGENAAKGFEAFAAQYAKARDLVPEWSAAFPQEPVDELGKALASGDPNQVMPAIGKVGGVCHGCHVQFMTPVQYKYHWRDTSSFAIDDPVTGQKIGYMQLMQFLGSSFAAIGANLAQGQKDAATKQLEAFKARFAALEEVCSECHDSAREYYVDDAVKSMIDDLAKEVAKDAPDPARVQQLSMSIGQESCFKCHLVHMPAALSKPRPPQGPPQ